MGEIKFSVTRNTVEQADYRVSVTNVENLDVKDMVCPERRESEAGRWYLDCEK